MMSKITTIEPQRLPNAHFQPSLVHHGGNASNQPDLQQGDQIQLLVSGFSPSLGVRASSFDQVYLGAGLCEYSDPCIDKG